MKSESEIIDLKVDGMTCSGCASSIETLLKRNKLDDVHVNFIDGRGHFSKDSKADIKKIVEGINQLGYKVRDVNEPKASFQLSLGVKLIIASLFTLPLLFTHILPHTFGILHNRLIQFLLAIPPMFTGFWTFLPGAVKSSLKGMPNMDVTICLAFIRRSYAVLAKLSFRYPPRSGTFRCITHPFATRQHPKTCYRSTCMWKACPQLSI